VVAWLTNTLNNLYYPYLNQSQSPPQQSPPLTPQSLRQSPPMSPHSQRHSPPVSPLQSSPRQLQQSMPKPLRTQSQPHLHSNVAKKRVQSEEDSEIEEKSENEAKISARKKRQTRDLNVKIASTVSETEINPRFSPEDSLQTYSEEKLQKLIQILQENISLMTKKYDSLKEKHTKLQQGKKEMQRMVNTLVRHTELLEQQVQFHKEKKV